LPNARLAINALIMITIEGVRRPGMNAAHKNLVKQLPLIAAEFPEIGDCHYGPINVQLHVPLLVVAPDHRSQPIPWGRCGLSEWRGLRSFTHPVRGASRCGTCGAWLYIPHGSPARATPQIHEVLARRLDIPAEVQCRVTINRNAVQLAYRYFPPMVIVV